MKYKCKACHGGGLMDKYRGYGLTPVAPCDACGGSGRATRKPISKTQFWACFAGAMIAFISAVTVFSVMIGEWS